MRKLVFASAAAMVLFGAAGARPQDAPDDFKLDTPPVPGQVQETPRDELRPGPSRSSGPPAEELGLQTSGPKAVDERVLESRNEPAHHKQGAEPAAH
jgi:hypothetical protein